MDLKPAVLALALCPCLAFAPAKKPARPAAPPAPGAAPPATPAEARDPEAWVQLLGAAGAKAEFADRQADSVKLKVTTPIGAFEMQFAGCEGQPRRCAAVLFDAADDKHNPTLAQINSFNQSSFACRITRDAGGRQHILYSAPVFASETGDEGAAVLNTWRGCIADFSAFLKDPQAYLAAAP